MQKIFLVRHGQDQDNAQGLLNGHRDTPLTDIGINQAKELAIKIKESDIKIDAVFSSPLRRALKTAQIICDTNNYPQPVVLDLLIERDFGLLTGTDRTKIREACGDQVLITPTVDYILDTHQAETFPHMINRANLLFDYLKQNITTNNILLVCHGDIGKMIYAAYYRLDWQDVLNQFHFGNSEMLELSSKSSPKNSHIIKTKQYNT